MWYYRATFTALAAFIEVMQKIADVASGAKGIQTLSDERLYNIVYSLTVYAVTEQKKKENIPEYNSRVWEADPFQWPFWADVGYSPY